MATYLKADAVKAVLEDLGVLDRAGNVSTVDSNRVGLRYDAALAAFVTDNTAVIASNAIPDSLFLPLVSWLVQECAPLFHKERDLDRAKDSLSALRSLYRRTLTAPSSSGDKFGAAVLRTLKALDTEENPTATDLLSVSRRMVAILADLSRRDVITITNQASIADAEFEPLVLFTAETLAPEIGGREAKPDVKAAAEAQLREVAREGYTVTDNATNRLAVRVLRALGVISRTANPSVKELATITARIELAVADLARRKIIVLSDADEAEGAGATDAMVDYLVALLAPEQENPLPAGQRIPTRQEAERRLRLIAAPEPAYAVQVAEYF